MQVICDKLLFSRNALSDWLVKKWCWQFGNVAPNLNSQNKYDLLLSPNKRPDQVNILSRLHFNNKDDL